MRNGTVRCTRWGVLRCHGPDASAFLHNMLTQDVMHQDADHAPLAGWCSPQGRLLASLVLLRDAQDTVFLLASQDLIAATEQGLRKYILRAKAVVEDCSAQRPVWGLVGEAVQAVIPPQPDVEMAPWRRWTVEDADVVRLPDARGTPRVLWIGNAPSAHPPATLPRMDEGTWEWLAVHSGIAWITARTSNLFVPQMLGYDALGAIDFRKGCYPGQEVIARSQYRGKVQRRAVLAHCAAAIDAGQEVYADPDTPCGTVVQSAASPDGEGTYDAIVCIHADAPTRIFATTTEGQPIALTLL